jgi:hypothetical protein
MLKFYAALCTAIACLVCASAGLAQAPKPLTCPECRAIAQFRGCRTSRDGAIAFSGKVTDVTRARCSHILTVDVARPSALGLPPSIQINLGYCAAWAGKPGDTIDLAVTSRAPDGKLYALACNLW